MEHFIQNIDFNQNIKRIKIDIGLGERNVNSICWLCNDNNLLVIGFDPNPKCIKNALYNANILEQKYKLNNHFSVIPIALNNVEQPTNMLLYNMQNDAGTSSLYEPIDKNLGPVAEVLNVQVYSLKHFFDLFPWDKFEYIEYIKIDAQGADLNIIKSAGDYLKERVVYITAEPENKQYKDIENNVVENFTTYLESQNFIRVYNKNTTDPTYINKKFLHLKDNIYIYQFG
jgi:FkbM family methyltransferase